MSLNIDLSAFHIPQGNHVLLEEVSEAASGGGVLWTNLPINSILSAVQGSNSVWLLTIPNRTQQAEQMVTATADAEVRDGIYRANNYGSAATMIVRNDPATNANRRAAFMKFHLPVTDFTSLESVVLSLQAACATSNTTAQAHVYFVTNTSWLASTITWSNAPNLKQNMSAGVMITHAVITGVDTNASIVGQLVVTSTNAVEKLIDLTDFMRRQTNQDFTILVVQDPRWNLTLPAQTLGDIQPDGIQITTSEGGSGPRLRVVLAATNNNPAIYWTNLLVNTEAFIRGGASADTDQDEAGLGYLMVKYTTPTFDSARKAYFQFNLAGLNVIGSTSAVFTVNFQNTFKQNVQLWALNQAYPNFTASVTWNLAQANDTNSNNLLTSGALTATAVGAVTNLPASGTTPQSFILPQIGGYVQGNLLTLALCGVTNQGIYTNDSGGLRILPGSATLQVLVSSALIPPQIAGLIISTNGSLAINFTGSANVTYFVQATTNLALGNWTTIRTDTTDANGRAAFTDTTTDFRARFYRVLAP